MLFHFRKHSLGGKNHSLLLSFGDDLKLLNFVSIY